MDPFEIQHEKIDEQPTAVMRATLLVSEMGAWIGQTYGAIARYLAEHGAAPAGPPFVRFHRLGEGRFDVEAGFPVGHAIDGGGDVEPSKLPGGDAASVIYVGPYDGMEPAYAAIMSWIGSHDGRPEGDAWEIYYSDPSSEPDPRQWRTKIVQPYRAA